MVASGIPIATPPNKIPIANPSGILCKVIAKVSKVVFCQGVLTPSESFSLKLMCKWGKTLSNPKRNKEPNEKPTAEGIIFTKLSPWLIAMAGERRLQKLARSEERRVGKE